MKSLLAAGLLALSLLLPPPAQAASPWRELNHLTVDAKTNGSRETQHWDFLIDRKHNDSLVTEERRHDGKTTNQGKLLTLAGQRLLMQGITPPAGQEIDRLDVPMLHGSLVLDLLGRLLPEGPDAIREKRPLQHRETSHTLHVSTTSASLSLKPPWQVSGSASPRTQGGIHYSLTVTGMDGTYKVELNGTWERLKDFDGLEDAMDVRGWKAYRLGVFNTPLPGGMTIDYGARPWQGELSTLGALRELLKKESSELLKK